MLVLSLLAITSVFDAVPREYVVDFKNAGENPAAYKITVTVVTQTGIQADIDFDVPADTSAGLLRDAVYAALKDCKGIEVKMIGDDLLRVKAVKNGKLLCVRLDGVALQQHTSLKGFIALELKMKAADK
jgi:hypothetical protein